MHKRQLISKKKFPNNNRISICNSNARISKRVWILYEIYDVDDAVKIWFYYYYYCYYKWWVIARRSLLGEIETTTTTKMFIINRVVLHSTKLSALKTQIIITALYSPPFLRCLSLYVCCVLCVSSSPVVDTKPFLVWCFIYFFFLFLFLLIRSISYVLFISNLFVVSFALFFLLLLSMYLHMDCAFI